MKVVKAIFFNSQKDKIKIVNYYLARRYIVEVFHDEKLIYVERKNPKEFLGRDYGNNKNK